VDYNTHELASRGGKRAQKTPNIPKSWGAEQKNPAGAVQGAARGDPLHPLFPFFSFLLVRRSLLLLLRRRRRHLPQEEAPVAAAARTMRAALGGRQSAPRCSGEFEFEKEER